MYKKTMYYEVAIESVKKDHDQYSRLKKIRYDVQACGLCGNEFEDEDWVSLTFVLNGYNRFVCSECAQEALDGGASSYGCS